jgi:uncharacterized membrane protein
MHRKLLLRTAILGFSTGLRSMSGMAALTLRANRAPGGFTGTPFGWLSYPQVAVAFGLFAAGELIADKLPIVPSRVRPVPLLGRALYGALAGSTSFTEANSPARQGALLGATCAVAGAIAGYNYRTRTARALQAPDLPLALIEDAATATLAAAALKTYD